MAQDGEAKRIVGGLCLPGRSPEQLLEVLSWRRADGREISMATSPLPEALSGVERDRSGRGCVDDSLEPDEGGREHRVPLCGRALKILDAARRLGDGGSPIVFLTERGKSLDEKRLCRLLEKHKIEAVPHCFRSSFRDWAAEKTNHPREVIEAALAHVVRNKVEAAYARSDPFERRRVLMDDWAADLAQGTATDSEP